MMIVHVSVNGPHVSELHRDIARFLVCRLYSYAPNVACLPNIISLVDGVYVMHGTENARSADKLPQNISYQFLLALNIVKKHVFLHWGWVIYYANALAAVLCVTFETHCVTYSFPLLLKRSSFSRKHALVLPLKIMSSHFGSGIAVRSHFGGRGV